MSDKNVFYMIDGDIDGSSSFLVNLVKSQDGAFSKPSLLCTLFDKVPKDKVISIVMNTKGGALCHLDKIMRKLKSHTAGYIVYVKNDCYSAGALLCLGAKEIVMNQDSCIGKIDPQEVGNGRTVIIYKNISKEHIDSRTIYYHKNALYLCNYTEKLLSLTGLDEKQLESVKENLLYSEFPHETLFDYEECKKMGLPVRKPRKDEETFFKNTKTNDYKAVEETKSNWSLWVVVVITIGLSYWFLRR